MLTAYWCWMCPAFAMHHPFFLSPLSAETFKLRSGHEIQITRHFNCCHLNWCNYVIHWGKQGSDLCVTIALYSTRHATCSCWYGVKGTEVDQSCFNDPVIWIKGLGLWSVPPVKKGVRRGDSLGGTLQLSTRLSGNGKSLPLKQTYVIHWGN